MEISRYKNKLEFVAENEEEGKILDEYYKNFMDHMKNVKFGE